MLKRIVLLVFLLLPLINIAQADNLVENGDFSQNWLRWARYGLTQNFFIATSTSPQCYPGHNGNPAAAFAVDGDQLAAIEQSVELPAGASYEYKFREWGLIAPTTVRVMIYDGNNDLHTIDEFIVERVAQEGNPGNPCTGKGPKTHTYDLSQYAGQQIVIRIEATDPSHDGVSALFDDFSIEGKNGVTGFVNAWQTRDPVEGITMRITGTTLGGNGVDLTTQTGTDGSYKFDVPGGNYIVKATGEGFYNDQGIKKRENGGVLSAELTQGGNCDGTANGDACSISLPSGGSRTANFGYTLCASEERKPHGEPLTHCPVILVPGFLGSKIACSTGELWPGLPLPGWGQMNLLSDGATNDPSFGACNQSADVVLGKEGIISTVAGASIYKGAIDFLDQEMPNAWAPSPYDWRKSPVIGAQHLELVVDSLLNASHAKHVVLYGHSMGGLVIRDYIRKPENENKVARIMTAGTPYWGAPKAHFVLLGGYVDSPAGTALDHLTWKTEIQKLARNLQGAFFLYPSKNFGPWLSLASSANALFEIQGNVGEDSWVQGLGANPQLLDIARTWHDQNDGFPQTDIDYRAFVGGGTPTVLESKIRRIAGQQPTGEFVIGNGDGTVPLKSATQGGSEDPSGYALGNPVPLYYRCAVGHVDLPGEEGVLYAIREFLIAGEDNILDDGNKCDFNGSIAYFPELTIGGNNDDVNTRALPYARSLASMSSAITVTVQSGSETLTLDQASDKGLVQYIPIGLKSALIIDDARPVTLKLSGKNVPFQIQKVGSGGNGPLVSYQPVKGGVSISSGAQIAGISNGKIKVMKLSKKAPTTTSKVAKKKNTSTVALSAKAPNGLLGTYYRIGTTAAKIYTRPLKIKSGKNAVKVSYYSVDLYGQAEKWKSVKVK